MNELESRRSVDGVAKQDLEAGTMIVARPKCALALLLGVVWTASVSPAVALWPASGGGPLDDSALATVTDQSGNIYVAGEFRGGAVFGGTTYSAGSMKSFCSSYAARS